MRRVVALVSLIAVVFLVVSVWWKNGTSALNPNNKKEVIFIVKKGEGIRSISNRLKKENLIKDPIVFFLLVKRLNLDNKIQAGDFRLSPSMDAEKIAENLTHGTLDIWLTITEGQRAEEIANLLEKNIPSYQKSWDEDLALNEGYLFPDTYLIPKDAGIDLVISIMKGNFEKKYSTISKKSSLSDRETVIIASLIEREAKLDLDRPLVASVIMNRLRIGMPLQIDATVQYALGDENNNGKWWKRDLTRDDLKIDSPYNTYVNVGLPPAPISNPGLDVLNAAANPVNSSYLYYISDSSGKNHYAKTIEEHNSNIRKYGL